MARFLWYGWETGEEAGEPEGSLKEILFILDDGEELATIVHRPTGHQDSEKWRLQKERNAQMIVDALNAWWVAQHDPC